MVQPQKTIDASTARWTVAFGQRLERARGRMGLTQAELAGPDLSKSFISLLETARSYPSVETLLALARRVGTSLSGLLLDEEELRLDAALSLMSLARTAAWRRPAWATKLLDTVEALIANLPGWLRAETTTIRGTVAAAENRLDRAARLARQAEARADQARFLPGKANAVALRGHVMILRREYAEAFDVLGQAVALYRESGSLRSEPGIMTLIRLANAALRVGRPRTARRLCQKARTLAVRLHLPRIEGLALWGLGELAWSAGDLSEAMELMRAARDAFEKSEDLFNFAEVSANLAALYQDQGKSDQALAAARQAVQVMDGLGHLRGRSRANQELAHILRQRGDLDEAARAAQQALHDAAAAGDRYRRALALVEFGRVAARRGQRSQALRHLGEARRLLRALKVSDAAAEVERDLGLVRQGLTPEAEAAHYLAQAIGYPDGDEVHPPKPARRRTSRTR